MFFLHKILAFWFTRIVIFLILFYAFSLVAYEFLGGDDTLGTSALFSFCLLAASAIIESIRKKSTWFLMGFFITKNTFREIFFGKIFALLALGFIGLTGICFGAEVSYNGVDITYSIYLLIYYFFVAFLEELIFRGIVFQTLMERFGASKTTITVSFLFGFAHYNNPNVSVFALINIVLAGICLSIMYIQTRGLWMPIMFHWVWNFSQEFFLGSPVSGMKLHDSFSTLDWTRLDGTAPILFGGDFGVEGGLLASIVLIPVILLTVRFFQPSPYIIARLFRRKFAEDTL